ncbi:MAG TPA: YheC/YheD family protein [Bacillota bacterium]|nr:YheC/YheD family protein [Bacillota bacterium]
MPVAKTAGRPVYLGVLISQNNLNRFTHLAKIPISVGESSDTKPVLYLFTLKDIDSEKLRIRGLFYDPSQNRWNSGIFPFPHVIYMRKIPDHLDKKAEDFLKLAEKMHIPLVNARSTFDKWELYRVLCTSPQIKPHLPDTRLYRGQESDISSMLNRYEKIYLKACRGSRGREVMKVSRLPGGLLEYSYYDGRLFIQRANNKCLPRIVANFFGQEEVIIQQPIDLISIGDRKADLRAEMQRNGEGLLEIVGMPVRVGHARSPITTHAACYRFEDFFGHVLKLDQATVSTLEDKLRRLLGQIYLMLEQHYGPFGELGIDIGVDRNFHPWFIECNAQSAKVSLMNAYGGAALLRAYINPLEYALKIAAPPPPGGQRSRLAPIRSTSS